MQNQTETIDASHRPWFLKPQVWQYHNTSTPKTRWSRYDFIEQCNRKIAEKQKLIAEKKRELQNLRFKNRVKRASIRHEIQWTEDAILNLQLIIDMQNGPEHLRAYTEKACNYPAQF